MNAHTGILLILAAMWLLWPTADYRPRVVNGFWALLAALVSTRPVRERIIRQAAKTPHYHLPDYMDRWWLLRLGYLNVRVHRGRQALKTRLQQMCLTCPVHGFLDCDCDAAEKVRARLEGLADESEI